MGRLEMQPPTTFHNALRQFIPGIVVVASLLAVPLVVKSPAGVVVVLGIVGGLYNLVLLVLSIERICAMACPACSRRTLLPIARHPNYFRCSECRAQFKWLGRRPWRDASGPDDAIRFRRSGEYGKWTGYAPPDNLDGSSSGHLLRTKRSRDLLGEVKRSPPRGRPERPIEEAERKVRKFLNRLKTLDDLEA
jgi:hypothetical protein